MTDGAAETLDIAVPIDCAHCGQPVRLTYRVGAHKQPISWSCPYETCQRSQMTELLGSIVEVVADPNRETPRPPGSELNQSDQLGSEALEL